MFDLPSSSLSTATRETKPASKRRANKYLELLGDNEDADGYQLPIHGSSRKSEQTNANNSPRTSDSLTNSTANRSRISEKFTKSLSLDSAYKRLSENSISANKTEISDESSSANEQNLLETTRDFSSESEGFPSWLGDCDDWSVSTGSTATVHLDSSIKRHSGLSCLSGISGIDLNYASKSSFC